MPAPETQSRTKFAAPPPKKPRKSLIYSALKFLSQNCRISKTFDPSSVYYNSDDAVWVMRQRLPSVAEAVNVQSEPVRPDASASDAAPSKQPEPPRPAEVGEVTGLSEFTDIVARFETPLLRYAAHLLGGTPTETAAEDIVQDTFLRLIRYQRKQEAEPIRDLSIWLFRVAHNLVFDIRRRLHKEERQREQGTNEPPGEHEQAAGAHETADIDGLTNLVRRAACERALEELNQLPSGQRQVILLKIIQDLNFPQISQITGLTVGNVAYRLNQGLNELARRLKDAGVI